MNTWVYRILMALLAVMIAAQVYAIATTNPKPEMCLGGIVMVPDKGGDMWIQKGLWAIHCMPIDKD